MVDVLQRTVFESARFRIVFLARQIVMGFFQQFQCMMQAAWMVDIGIFMWMIMQVFLVFTCCFFNFAKCGVDFGDGDVLPGTYGRVTRTMFQIPMGIAQVRQSVKVARVLAGNICVSEKG